MQPRTTPVVPPTHLAYLAMVSGVLMSTAVVLWVLDIVSVEVFIAAILVIGLAQGIAFLLVVRRGRQRASRADRLASSGGTSTVGPDGADARYGYDPMADIG